MILYRGDEHEKEQHRDRRKDRPHAQAGGIIVTFGCPGSVSIRGTPTLAIKKCPGCGNEVELFSIDAKAECEQCGFVVYNDRQSCILWCRHAKKCFGEATHKMFADAAKEMDDANRSPHRTDE